MKYLIEFDTVTLATRVVPTEVVEPPKPEMPPVLDVDNAFANYFKRAGEQLGVFLSAPYMEAGTAAREYDVAQGLDSGSTDANKMLWPAAAAAYFAKQKPAAKKLSDTYPSKDALLAACEDYGFGVILDGAVIHQGSGPSDHFWTLASGSVARV